MITLYQISCGELQQVQRGTRHILDSLGAHCLMRKRQTLEPILIIQSTNRSVGMSLWEHSGRPYEPYLEWVMVVITESPEKRFTADEFTILSTKRSRVAPTLKVRMFWFLQKQSSNLPSTICLFFIHSFT